MAGIIIYRRLDVFDGGAGGLANQDFFAQALVPLG
jgi:hypothetical protein